MENYNNFNDYNNYNNYNQPNNNMFGNMPQGQYPTPIQKYKGWKIASLIFGILSLLSCLLFFFSIPLGIIGLLSAIIYACCAKKLCAGLWINIISIVLSFVMIFVIVIGLSFINTTDIPVETTRSIEFNNPIQAEDGEELNVFENALLKLSDSVIGKIEENGSTLQGTWELIDYNDEIIEGKEKVAKCTINPDNTFVWSKYGDEENNYVKGTYKIHSLSVENNEWNYYVDFNINEYSIDGVVQTEDPFTEEYDIYIVVEDDKTEAIFYNVNAENYFYSSK